jgi:hypothetical protein
MTEELSRALGDVDDPELAALVRTYEAQAYEWQAIKGELIAAARSREIVTAFQVTLEQRKRMLARGERPVDVERMIELGNLEAEASRKGGR